METSGEDFKTLLQNHPFNIPKVGDMVKGKIISADKGEVRIDLENLTTAVVRGDELFSESSEYSNLKTGDEIEAMVIDLENENGEMELSFRVAGLRRVWDNLNKWMKQGITLKAKILSANKGGLLMQVGAISGFMPVSQLSPDNYPRVAGGDKSRILEKLQTLIGREMEVKVIDLNEREEKVIVSEKAVWEDSQKAVLESYKIGEIVEGEVSAITSFGVFVKFGEGLEGLVHISEIAWQRIDHPRDVLKVGDRVRAQIIQLDRSKIYLSVKRLVEDPWKKVKDKYKVDDTVKGKILKIEPFGLMISLDKEIHGLAHISELFDESYSGDLREKFKIGQETDFVVVSLEPAEHRLGLRLAGVKGKSGRKIEVIEEKEEKAEEKVEEKIIEEKVEEKIEEKIEEKKEEPVAEEK